MDLFADLKRIVEAHLKTLGVAYSATDKLEDLMLLVTNYELKTVKPQPRRAHLSKEFSQKLAQLATAQQQAADAIIKKFERGDDVNGHLSKSSAKPAETDALLADWKIHHLHISTQKKNPSDKFYPRTGPVMFARIEQNAVYFIDIYEHGKGFPETWTRQKLLEILDANWSHILDPHRLQGVTGLAFTASDSDVKALRGANVNTILQIGKSFIAPPGGGLATSGVATANVLRTDKTLHVIRDLEQEVGNKAAELKRAIAAQKGVSETDMDFQLVPLDSKGWGVVEVKTQTLVASRQ